jgi:hypothetical protein
MSTALIPKLDGFHRCPAGVRRTYFDVIDSRLASTYGHTRGDRISMPTLIPVT